MKKRKYFGLLFVAILFASCASPADEITSLDVPEQDVSNNEYTAYDGFQLLQSTCFSCHSPNPLNENNIAPTIAEIKNAYITQFSEQKEFENAIARFLNKPSEDIAIMKDAVSLFGAMPQMGGQQSQSKVIAAYLFANDIEGESWFSNEFPKEELRIAQNQDQMSFSDRGFEYAMSTKSLLGKNLKGQIKNKGTLEAVKFCNLKAWHFTDSMSTVYDAEIKRVTDKARNTSNRANEDELAVIDKFKKQLNAGQEIIPITVESEKNVIGYYPIVTNDMCLKCHGAVTDIEEETFAKIKELYPADMAMNYSVNELRGIWAVKMKKR